MTDGNILGKNTRRGWPRLSLDTLFNAALIAFFFLLPLQTRYIFRAPMEGGVPYEYGTLSVFLAEILGWIVIGVGLWQGGFRSRIRAGSCTAFRMIIVGLLIWAFFSIIWAPDKLVAFQAAVRLLEGILLLFVARYTLHVTRYRIFWAFLAGAIIQAALGIYQFLTQSTLASTLLGMALHDPQMLGISVVEFGAERWLRAYGGLPHPNVLGGYLVVALAVLLQHKSIKALKHESIAWWIVVPILLTGIFFSFSRAAWAAAIVVLGYWVIEVLKNICHFDRVPRDECLPALGEEKSHTVHGEEIPHPDFASGLGMTILYVVLLVVMFRPLVATRIFFNDSRLEVKSRTERASGLRESWGLIKTYPVAGVGIGNYTQAVARALRPKEPLYTYQPVHNVPLLILSELGIMGLALFASALYYILKQSRSNALVLSCFVVLMMIDHYLWTLPLGILLFWGVLGLSTSQKKAWT